MANIETVEDAILARFQELRVAQNTPSKELAGAILRYFEEGKKVALSVIGAQAAAQALKAVAIANEELIKQGRYFAIVPAFDLKRVPDRETGREIELTAIRLIVGRIPIML